MAIWDSFIRLAGGFTRTGAFRSSAEAQAATRSPRDPLAARYSTIAQYQTLWAMYENNGLYERLSDILKRQGLWSAAMQPLRNPANRIVEFHASKMWPGANLAEALPIEGANDQVQKAITQIWTWSNFAARKQVWARWGGVYGDLFVKVVGQTEPYPKVYYQLILPEYCTDVTHDARGHLTHVRLDVPMVREKLDGTSETYWYTEIWDKPSDSLTIWEHDRGPLANPRDMGTPLDSASILERHGVDFIPIVQGQFKDVGGDRGHGAYSHAFDKINEANRVATRLHQMAFRHSNVTIALTAGGMDANMMPFPAPEIEFDDGSTSTAPSNDLLDGTSIVGDDRVLKLPGNADVKFLVPNLPYESLVRILESHMGEIEHDCPEMAYYRLKEMGSQLSGRAVRLMLSDAIDRGLEARGNAEQALILLNKMALTIGQQIGAFPGLVGSYAQGTWDHTFHSREFIPESDLEVAQAELTQVQAKVAKGGLGIPDSVLQAELGYSEEQIAEMADEMARQKQDAIQSTLAAAAAGNVGLNPGPVGAPGRNSAS